MDSVSEIDRYDKYQNPRRSDEVSFMEIFVVLWERKWMIVGLVCISLLIATIYVLMKYPVVYTTSVDIRLEFPGIENHENPDGSRFEARQIISPRVFSLVRSSLGERVQGIDDLNALVYLEPAFQNVNKKESSEEQAGNDKIVVPAKIFRLVFHTNDKTLASKGLGNELLLAIVDGYRKVFNAKYNELPLLSVTFNPDVLNLEYAEITRTFNLRIQSFKLFLESKIEDAGFFRSKTTGRSFVDLKDDFDFLEVVEVANAESFIQQNFMTRNIDQYLSTLKNRSENLRVQAEKMESKANVAKELLNNIVALSAQATPAMNRKDMPEVIIDNSIVDRSMNSRYFKKIIESALDAGVMAAEHRIDRQTLEMQIDELSKTSTSRESSDLAEKNQQILEKKLLEIHEKLKALAEEANDLNREYLMFFSDNSIKITDEPVSNSGRMVGWKKLLLFVTLLGFGASLVLVFILNMLKGYRLRSS